MGGNLDFTVKTPDSDFPSPMSHVLEKVLQSEVGLDQITLSSDSNGSMPVFNEHGKLVKMTVGNIGNLYNEWKGLVLSGFPLEDALQLITSNPARRTGIFRHKGSLDVGKNADLLILGENFEIDTVIARGQLMAHQGEILVKGTFEE